MKRIIQVEREFCDEPGCNAEAPWGDCLTCGKAYCYDHRKTRMVEYSRSPWSGGDAYYCRECDTELHASRADALHNAYVACWALKLEETGFYQLWTSRAKEAEAEVERLKKQRADRLP